jgi:hypothetical protein
VTKIVVWPVRSWISRSQRRRGRAASAPSPPPLAQPAAQVLADLRVERAERLVEEQDARLDGERAGERDALALAARELRGIAVGEARQPDQVEQLADAALDLRRRRPLRALSRVQPVGDVVGHAHVLEQRVVLEHEPDRALLHRQEGGVVAAEQDAAAVRRVEPGDDAQQRRLARARGAEQAEQLARAHVEVEVVQHGGRVEGLRQALDADRGRVRVNAVPATRAPPRSAIRGGI